jgi:predicted membrane protein
LFGFILLFGIKEIYFDIPKHLILFVVCLLLSIVSILSVLFWSKIMYIWIVVGLIMLITTKGEKPNLTWSKKG